jgi:hypothetical protein
MWSGSFLCLSFKLELFEAVHNFLTDSFRLALYSENANLTPSLAGYETQGELLSLNGYTAGGQLITVYPPRVVNTTALVEFDDVTWTNANFAARGAVAYNFSKPGLPTLFVLDFGATRIANAGNFTVRFPGPDPNAAILRIA